MAHTVSAMLTDDNLNKIIAIESAGKPQAKASTSSASGLFQFLKATWNDVVNKYFPKWRVGRSSAAVNALRAEAEYAILGGVKFTEANARGLGAGWTEGDLYLAHFLGLGSAKKVLRANPSRSAVDVCGPDAAKSNRTIFYRNKKSGASISCGELRAWAQKSMDTRWAKLGNRDFIKQFWKGGAVAKDSVEQAPEVVQPADAVAEATTPTESKWAAAMSGKFNKDCQATQRMLKGRGYSLNDDGKWGGATLGMVGAFMLNRGEKGAAVLSDRLQDELLEAEIEGWKRPIPAAREEAKTEDLQEKLPEVAEAKKAEKTASRITIGGIFTAVITAIGNGLATTFEWAQNLMGIFSDMPWWVWVILLIVGSLLVGTIALRANNAGEEAADAYREGART